jgi:methionine-rich copper-binding protein CopC
VERTFVETDASSRSDAAGDANTKTDGQRSDARGGDGAPDHTSPTVVSTAPADGASGVPATTTFSFTFSEAMDPSTVALTVQPTVAVGPASWNSDNSSVSFAPSAPLVGNTMYKATIAGADLAGNPLAGVLTFSFTTQAAPDTTPPTIVSTVPRDGTIDVATTTGISISFSEPMDEGTVTVTAVPDIALGVPTFDAPKTQVSFTPTARLATATSYTITVKGQDPSHNALAGTTQFKFTTVRPPDTMPPTVASITPANGAMGVANNSSIVVTFSEAMNTTATAAAFAISGGVTCTGGWIWNMAGTSATCTPAAALADTTTYNVAVSTAAKDLAGNALAAPFSASFTTGVKPDTTAPTIVSVNPANNTSGVVRNAKISVTFSEAMDLASAQAAFQVTQPAGVTGTFSWAAGNLTMTFSPSATFAYGDVVRFQVTTAAKDAAGNAKATTDSFSFTVIKSTTVNFPCIDALDGFVNAVGTAFPARELIGGNGGTGSTGMLRGYEAYDISALPATTTAITAAYIYIYQYSVASAPYGATALGDLMWYHVDFGPTLEATDFGTPVLTHPYPSGVLSTTPVLEWKSSSVVFAVQNDFANRTARNNRSEFVIQFPNDSSSNGIARYAYLYACNTANASFHPYLAVTYEYP